jgi:hypothetical protein
MYGICSLLYQRYNAEKVMRIEYKPDLNAIALLGLGLRRGCCFRHRSNLLEYLCFLLSFIKYYPQGNASIVPCETQEFLAEGFLPFTRQQSTRNCARHHAGIVSDLTLKI